MINKHQYLILKGTTFQLVGVKKCSEIHLTWMLDEM